MENIKRVAVKASGSYDVVIGKGILDNAGKLVAEVKKPCRAVIVTDSNVDALYSDRVRKSLVKEGFDVSKFTFIAGEDSKCADTFIDMLEWLAEQKITRSDLLVALGGGVVGDITGFTASCYLRGIDFVQIPTTLLAAVDSSVGGKTAIDLKAGKNLAGAFYQPIVVICDTDTFETLPPKEVACGYAEVIKYGVLFDEKFFEGLENSSLDMETIVEKCVEFKRDVVERDEFDRGERKLLNLGHTAAHGIEKASGFTVTHGEAVAIGTVIASTIAVNEGLFSKEEAERIEKILRQYNLPTLCTTPAEEIFDAALSDKKRESANITLVLPEKIGKCVLKDVPVMSLLQMFKTALKK